MYNMNELSRHLINNGYEKSVVTNYLTSYRFGYVTIVINSSPYTGDYAVPVFTYYDEGLRVEVAKRITDEDELNLLISLYSMKHKGESNGLYKIISRRYGIAV